MLTVPYIHILNLGCTPKTNMLHVNYISKNQNNKNKCQVLSQGPWRGSGALYPAEALTLTPG